MNDPKHSPWHFPINLVDAYDNTQLVKYYVCSSYDDNVGLLSKSIPTPQWTDARENDPYTVSKVI